MSFLGDLFNSSNGAGFQAANAPTADQLALAQQQAQAGITQQQGLASALNGGVTAGANQQAQLAQALQAQANGQGPNVAQNQLAQATGANVANQGSLMAGQRGAGSNVALIARQAAQQGAQTQQQAAGQAATLGAQQQIAAQQGLANLSSTQVNQGQTATNAANSVIQGNQGQLLGANQGANAVNAGIAQGNQAAQAGATSGLISGAGSAISSLIPKMAEGGTVPAEEIPVQSSLQSAPVSNPNSVINFLQAPQPSSSSVSNSNAGSIASAMSTAIGGAIGGIGKSLAPKTSPSMPGSSDTSSSDDGAAAADAAATPATQSETPDTSSIMDMAPALAALFAKGGQVKGEFKGGDKLNKVPAKDRFSGSTYDNKLNVNPKNLEGGGKVDGKAKVKGNSQKNDIVPIMASPGEIVIPRSVIMGPDPINGAAKFVAEALRKHGSSDNSDFHEALKSAIKSRKK